MDRNCLQCVYIVSIMLLNDRNSTKNHAACINLPDLMTGPNLSRKILWITLNIVQQKLKWINEHKFGWHSVTEMFSCISQSMRKYIYILLLFLRFIVNMKKASHEVFVFTWGRWSFRHLNFFLVIFVSIILIITRLYETVVLDISYLFFISMLFWDSR